MFKGTRTPASPQKKSTAYNYIYITRFQTYKQGCINGGLVQTKLRNRRFPQIIKIMRRQSSGRLHSRYFGNVRKKHETSSTQETNNVTYFLHNQSCQQNIRYNTILITRDTTPTCVNTQAFFDQYSTCIRVLGLPYRLTDTLPHRHGTKTMITCRGPTN
jgi:hypothetical protein